MSSDDRQCPRPGCFRTFDTEGACKNHLKSRNSGLCYDWYYANLLSTSSPSRSPSSGPTSFDPSESAHQLEELLKAARSEDAGDTDEFDNEVKSYTRSSSPDSTTSNSSFASSQPESTSSDGFFYDYFPGAGKTFGRGFDTLSNMAIVEEFREARKKNLYYPFSCESEWEVAAWLCRLNVSMTLIDEFFKLKLIQNLGVPFSFKSARELRSLVESLPSPPRWKSKVMTIPGGSSKETPVFYYRDGLESFQYLFGNPLFVNDMEFVPYKQWADKSKSTRVYKQPMSGTKSWKIQKQCGEGETLGLVLLSSDETQLTGHTGDKNCHPLYLSCGNIDSSLRAKLSTECWLMIGQIPIVVFDDYREGMQSALEDRLYHACVEIACEGLIAASQTPTMMVDAHGYWRLMRMILFAVLADFPEFGRITCTTKNLSPISLANFESFHSPKAAAPRHGSGTLRLIRDIITGQGINPDDVHNYVAAAKVLGLTGVHEPFWRKWRFADPSEFLAPDALHQWHRFSWDHLMKWASNKKLLGKLEIDARYSCLQKTVGERHFKNGFVHFGQVTGREQRDLAKHFVAVLPGHKKMNKGVLASFRAMLDFIYIAQYESHDTKTLRYLSQALQTFHENKQALADTGLRNGKQMQGRFRIPKLELMHNVVRLIKLLGSTPQYSTDQTEHLHQSKAKRPFKASNRKDFVPQTCRYLDRDEKTILFGIFLDWYKMGGREHAEALEASEGAVAAFEEAAAAANEEGDEEKAAAMYLAAAASQSEMEKRPNFQETDSFLALKKRHSPPSITNYFLDPDVPRNETTAFVLTVHIPYQGITIGRASELSNILEFHQVLLNFFGRMSRNPSHLSFNRLDVWTYVRMQLCAVQDENQVLPPVTVSAEPPSQKFPRGLQNFVLVREDKDAVIKGIQGHYVAQLCMIFRPVLNYKGDLLPIMYAVIQPFQPLTSATKSLRGGKRAHVPNKNINMFCVRRCFSRGEKREYRVVRLTEIWRPVELIPRFGKQCPSDWDAWNATELSKEFYVNSFSSKEVYQSVY